MTDEKKRARKAADKLRHARPHIPPKAPTPAKGVPPRAGRVTKPAVNEGTPPHDTPKAGRVYIPRPVNKKRGGDPKAGS